MATYTEVLRRPHPELPEEVFYNVQLSEADKFDLQALRLFGYDKMYTLDGMSIYLQKQQAEDRDMILSVINKIAAEWRKDPKRGHRSFYYLVELRDSLLRLTDVPQQLPIDVGIEFVELQLLLDVLKRNEVFKAKKFKLEIDSKSRRLRIFSLTHSSVSTRFK